MSYEYTDEHGDSLLVRSVIEGEFLVKVGHGSGHGAGISIPNEDAPAVALAILEAAGVTPSIGYHPDATPEEFESAAAFYLREAINKRSKQAEREAEDAKVREFMRAILPGSYQTDQSVTDGDRDRYRAARDFFAKEDTPAPRVLQYGDPEPQVGDAWLDQQGETWRPVTIGGWSHDGVTLFDDWSDIPSTAFPMTEVTGK